MTSEKNSGARRCRHCGTRIRRSGAKECWLCHEETAIRAGTPKDAREREHAERKTLPEPKKDFGAMGVCSASWLSSFLFGLVIEAPGVLVGVLVLATSVLIRSMIVSRKQEHVAPEERWAKVGFVFSTLGVIVTIGLASFAAFFVACCLTFLGGSHW